MPIHISAEVWKKVSEEKHRLSLSNFSDDLCKIADRVLDLVEYDDNSFSIIEEYDVVANDNCWMFTVLSYHCDSSVEQPCVLEVRGDDGIVHYVNTVI